MRRRRTQPLGTSQVSTILAPRTPAAQSSSRMLSTSPGRHSSCKVIGRQQTLQSSIMVCSPCEVSICNGKTSPQCGHETSTSTSRSIRIFRLQARGGRAALVLFSFDRRAVAGLRLAGVIEPLQRQPRPRQTFRIFGAQEFDQPFAHFAAQIEIPRGVCATATTRTSIVLSFVSVTCTPHTWRSHFSLPSTSLFTSSRSSPNGTW